MAETNFEKVVKRKEKGKRVPFEEVLKAWEKDLESEFEDNRRAETLSAEDFRILGGIRWRI